MAQVGLASEGRQTKGETDVYTEDPADVLNVGLHELFDGGLGEALIVDLVRLLLAFRGDFEVIIESVHVHFFV